jgi:hypothetical protein
VHRATLRTALIPLFVSLVAACSSGPASTENAATESEDVVAAGAFAGAGYYQIDYADPTAGEVTLLSLATNGSFYAERCADAACAQVDGLSGTYTHSKTKLHFYDASKKSLGSWSYWLDSGSIWLRATGSRDTYPLDPMSEDLCDSSSGAWSDDDLAAHGFNCTCPTGQDWGPGGCDGCAYGSCASDPCGAGLTRCGIACVDTSSDRSNCGACNAACAKAQSCVGGTCE